MDLYFLNAKLNISIVSIMLGAKANFLLPYHSTLYLPNPNQKTNLICFISLHMYLYNSYLLFSYLVFKLFVKHNNKLTFFLLMGDRFENITFRRRKYEAKARGTVPVHIIIFEAADRDDIGGSVYGGQRAICCTRDLAKMGGCKQGEVIRRGSATDINWPVIVDVYFKGKSRIASLDSKEVPITKTGMYNLFFVACDPKLKEIVMTGKTIWKNPDGFLPGRMAPLKKFYVFMALAYIFLGMIWLLQYVRFWDDILQLQHCISAVIGLGLFEMILWYFEYTNFNNTGVRPIIVTTWVVTIGAIRKTIARLLILSVSMGYGVVRPTLGGLTSKVLLLGITYLLASELLNITEYVGTINDVSGRARLILVLPDAFLDAFLILWIFTSLSKTLEQLQVSFLLRCF